MPNPEDVIPVVEEMQQLLKHDEGCQANRVPLAHCECRLKPVVERSDALLRACYGEAGLHAGLADAARCFGPPAPADDEALITLAIDIRTSRAKLRALIRDLMQKPRPIPR